MELEDNSIEDIKEYKLSTVRKLAITARHAAYLPPVY